MSRSGAALTLAAAVASGLAVTTLWPLFESWEWYAPTLLAVATVALVGWLARSARWPLLLTPLLQGMAVLLVMAWLLARDSLWLGPLPGVETVDALRNLLEAGVEQSNTYAPPVPVVPGLIAIAMLGGALVALLVDVTAVTLRSPALAGLPILAAYVVPAALVARGTPWWSFVPGAVGWLILLVADARVSATEWAGRSTQRASATPAGGQAWMAGSAAVAVAVLLPLLVPGLAEPLLRPGSGGSGPGGGESLLASGITVNPLASLKRDYLDTGDRTVLTVTSDAPTAPYLRLVGLDVFDGTTWRAEPMSPQAEYELNLGLPGRVPGLVEQNELPSYRYTIRVSGLSGPYLPQPYPTVRQTIGGGWFVDPATATVFSEQFDSDRTVYTATALDVNLDADAIRERVAGSVSTPPTQPASVPVPESVAVLARDVTREADGPFDAAVALQEWFRSEFRYSTTVRSGSDSAYLEQFLADRVGYCEQFAATMALMARSLGIPSRVAVGFAPGQPTGTPGTWEVSARDAHAWPELWLPGMGWTRFEPTPRAGDGARVTAPAYTQPDPDSSGSSPRPTTTPSTAGQSRSRAERADAAATNPAAGGGSLPGSGGGMSGWLLLAVAVLAVVLAVPLALRLARRRRRLGGTDSRAVALGAWADLRDTVIDHGRSWDAAHTPRQVGERLGGSVGMDQRGRQALARLVAGTESAAYRADGHERESAAVRSDLRAVRHSLAQRTPRGARWRALLFPASARPALRPRGGTTAARRGGGSSGPRRGS